MDNLRGLMPRRADYSDTFGHHDLIPSLRVKVARAHEACLRGMSMDPTQHEQVLLDAVVQHARLVLHLTSVRRALLLRDEQTADKQRVINRSATKYATHFDALAGMI